VSILGANGQLRENDHFVDHLPSPNLNEHRRTPERHVPVEHTRFGFRRVSLTAEEFDRGQVVAGSNPVSPTRVRGSFGRARPD
jgi:hypothetical protein